MNRILVTGANGFVGSALVDTLLRQDSCSVAAAIRRPQRALPRAATVHCGLELAPDTEWSAALQGVSCVIHTAARVHVMHEIGPDALLRFRIVNVQGTVRLAAQAAAAGVRRFVYLSSIKVNGESTVPGSAFGADDPPQVRDPYGISKLEAELALREIAACTGLELVVVRPPLVYGVGVRANFRSMMRWLQRGIPLPLGAIDNRRSLIALDNLVDVLVVCSRHPAAAGQTFLASDDEDLSTTDLLRRLGQALGRPARLVPVPAAWLRTAFHLFGKADLAQRLCGSLQVDIGKTRALLGWTPPVGVTRALEQTAADFLANQRAVGAPAT